MKESEFDFSLLTSARWKDIEILFGERGACGGCWCMAWRLSSKDFSINKGSGNRKLFRKIVDKKSPGIIAYSNNIPVGWCAFASREEYTRLENSRVLKKIDEQKVLSVSCFFIRKDFRKKGLTVKLLKEVIKYARKEGIKIVEGYPVAPYSPEMPGAFAWTGLPASFEKAGFTAAAKRGKRKIMRYYL